ncbi:uncharacterized protein [Diabrotica undecimpunctata]|uniref:uncharacterized protein n=1 Tax=Diabrotica undecimpunctata TaxID=50387 RepID=UPI003B635EC6
MPTLKAIQREVNADSDDTLNKISMRVLQRTGLSGHTKSKVWQDLNIKSARQAFIEGLSTGLKAPSGKGRRLIITHIGSDSGFLQDGLNVFTSIKTGDYHGDMNSDVFEKWFSYILTLVDPGSVIIMDNAPYHSRRMEKIPTSASRKADIIDWLRSKNIDFDESMIKVQILDIVREHKSSYIRFAVDEMAREHGITVLRTLPYHYQAIQNITAFKGQSCIKHTQNEEDKMWDVDTRVDVFIEPIIITPGEDSSDSELTTGSHSE